MAATAVFRHDLFLEHDPGYGHPESPERLRVIYQALDRPEAQTGLIFPDFAPATTAELALNHTLPHIERVAATVGKSYAMLDPDTVTSPRSYEAACLAAGAAIAGARLIMSGAAKNGFALVRPPGHHAECDHTSGFCLFNNIAIAARYAMDELGARRVLIVDWDLHHGNGTQHSFYDTDRVLYFSTHQYPYFPGSGALHEVGQGAGEGYTVNVPLPGGQDDRAFARIFRELLSPVARQFKPDLILVSAGFDIYQGDPLGSMAVTTDGFAYLTRLLMSLAAELCQDRLLLVLEGGYHLTGERDGVMAVLAELAGRSILGPDLVKELDTATPPLAALDNARNIAKKHWNL